MKGDYINHSKPQLHTADFVCTKQEEPVCLLLHEEFFPQGMEMSTEAVISVDAMKDAFLLWTHHIVQQDESLLATFFISDVEGRIIDACSLSDGGCSQESSLLRLDWPSSVTDTLSQGTGSAFNLKPADVRSEKAWVCALPVVYLNQQTAFVLGAYGVERIVAPLGMPWLVSAGTVFLPYLYSVIEKKRRQELAAAYHDLKAEAIKLEMRFQITQALQSKIDVEDVLAEIISRVKDLYPHADADLFMTQDYHSSTLPVKPLRFEHMEEDACTRAFMEGELIVEKDPSTDRVEVVVPLTGKQGVYGVLQLLADAPGFDSGDIQLFKILASAAGTAFENAKLYEQSNLLVNELRLINELTKRLNTSLKLNEIFNFASTELLHIFNADYSCILQLDRSNDELIVQASNLPAMFQENFKSDYGYAGLVCSTREPVIVSDYWSNVAVGSKLMEVTGSRSMIASPILVNTQVEGVILVTHRLPNYFSYDNYKLLQVLSGHIGLAIANASLHAEVKRMVITDNLTGLYARHYLDEQIGIMQKKDFSGSLIVVDIDNFKAVNDTYGHQIGDQILIQVSRVIRTSIRDSDVAARWGGEELAIYLPQVSLEQAVRIAERIRTRVSQETKPGVTVSCGVSEWNWQDEKISVESLFYRSDMALYRAKNDGKNKIKIG